MTKDLRIITNLEFKEGLESLTREIPGFIHLEKGQIVFLENVKKTGEYSVKAGFNSRYQVEKNSPIICYDLDSINGDKLLICYILNKFLE